MKALKVFTLSLSFFILNSGVFAQTLTIEVEKDTISMEEQIQVKYTLDKSCKGSELQFKDLIVVAGPYTSKSVSIVNGKKTAESSFTFILTAMKEGTFELPSELCGTKLAKPMKIVAIAGYESHISKDERIRKARKIRKI